MSTTSAVVVIPPERQADHEHIKGVATDFFHLDVEMSRQNIASLYTIACLKKDHEALLRATKSDVKLAPREPYVSR